MLAALVTRCGGEAVPLGTARDSEDDLRGRLAQADGLDLLLTTGGVSVGDYDLVKQVLQAEGRIDLWEVRIKPGKPLAFGCLGRTPVLGLPGNPVAAAVAFEQFARPAIRKMLGDRCLEIPTVHGAPVRPGREPGRSPPLRARGRREPPRRGTWPASPAARGRAC